MPKQKLEHATSHQSLGIGDRSFGSVGVSALAPFLAVHLLWSPAVD